MAMLGGNSVFLDTNVLIHATIAQSQLYRIAQDKIAQLKRDGNELWISRQVLREYLAALTRPQAFLSLTRPLPISTLSQEVRHLKTQYRVAEDVLQVTEELLNLTARYPVGGKQVHDANIAATMLVYGIRQILTENTSDFNRFAGLINIVPLL